MYVSIIERNLEEVIKTSQLETPKSTQQIILHI